MPPPVAALSPKETPALVAAKVATQKRVFLEQFRAAANITAACRVCDIHRSTHYDWLETDAEYAAAFELAKQEACDMLISEARRRALVGVEEPVFGTQRTKDGEAVTGKVGVIRKYSDTLLIFLMKGAMPETYRERFEHSGPKGGPIPLALAAVPLHDLSPEELDVAERMQARFEAGKAKSLPAEIVHAS